MCYATWHESESPPPLPLTIDVEHDAAEGIWFVVASDISGLTAEAPFDELVANIADIFPDLAAANPSDLTGAADIPLSIQHQLSVRHGRAA